MNRTSDFPAISEDSLTIEELAAQQGVKPIEDFDSLLGNPSEEDESVEEFAAMLRRWRHEPAGPPSNQ